MLSFWHCIFAMPKHIDVISWLANNNGEMVIYAFLLSPSCQKKWLWETAPPARFMGVLVKPTWMDGVVLLPLKMEVQLVIFSPLD